jgi:hypothetical protein
MSAAGPVVGTYPRPRHGWTCFHCGDTFTTPGAAQLHFGHTPMDDPACRIKAGEEYGLLIALRKIEKDYEALIDRMHELDGQIEVVSRERAEVLRAVKAGSLEEARNAWESMEGRAIAAEATVAEIERHYPAIVEAAREEVCRPKTLHEERKGNG